MSQDGLKYSVKLYELENKRWNYYVYVATRMAQGWSQEVQIGFGTANSEAKAIAEAQKKATADRQEREKERASMRVVALQ